MESERSRVDLAARAALVAITQAEGGERTLALDGCTVVSAFDREFVKRVGIRDHQHDIAEFEKAGEFLESCSPEVVSLYSRIWTDVQK